MCYPQHLKTLVAELVHELSTVLVAQSITTAFVVTEGPLGELVDNYMDASLKKMAVYPNQSVP